MRHGIQRKFDVDPTPLVTAYLERFHNAEQQLNAMELLCFLVLNPKIKLGKENQDLNNVVLKQIRRILDSNEPEAIHLIRQAIFNQCYQFQWRTGFIRHNSKGQIVSQLNYLHSCDLISQLFAWFKSKHTQGQVLDLSYQGLHRWSDVQILASGHCLEIMKVTDLDLKLNLIGRISTELREYFFQFLEIAPLKSLILSHNELFKFQPKDWHRLKQVLQTGHFEYVDLSCNKLGKMNDEQWQAFFKIVAKTNIPHMIIDDTLSKKRQQELNVILQNKTRHSEKQTFWQLPEISQSNKHRTRAISATLHDKFTANKPRSISPGQRRRLYHRSI